VTPAPKALDVASISGGLRTIDEQGYQLKPLYIDKAPVSEL